MPDELHSPTAATGLDHVGVAVQDADAVAELLCEALDAQRSEAMEFSSEGLTIVTVTAGDTHIELFEPLQHNSVARFLDKRGNAMHHLCFQVPDLDRALARLRERGIQVIDDTPRQGAYGTRVAFIHPKATGGILIELSSRAPA